jgi:hypothetical protein
MGSDCQTIQNNLKVYQCGCVTGTALWEPAVHLVRSWEQRSDSCGPAVAPEKTEHIALQTVLLHWRLSHCTLVTNVLCLCNTTEIGNGNCWSCCNLITPTFTRMKNQRPRMLSLSRSAIQHLQQRVCCNMVHLSPSNKGINYWMGGWLLTKLHSMREKGT